MIQADGLMMQPLGWPSCTVCRCDQLHGTAGSLATVALGHSLACQPTMLNLKLIFCGGFVWCTFPQVYCALSVYKRCSIRVRDCVFADFVCESNRPVNGGQEEPYSSRSLSEVLSPLGPALAPPRWSLGVQQGSSHRFRAILQHVPSLPQ